MNIIEVRDLNFEYFPKTVLKDVNVDIRQGNVTALVGPNGAGKTTFLRLLTGLITPLTGTVKVKGINVFDRPRDVHKTMGYLSDFFGLYNNLTIRQGLTYMAWCHKIPKSEIQARVNETIEKTGLDRYADENAGTLSRGYRQRMGIALALIHQPEILLLDEPASGMDPEARINLSKLILDLKKTGITIIVSSHILAELEDYCTDMLVIRDGKIAEHISLAEHVAQEKTELKIRITDMTDEHVKFISDYKLTKDTSADGNLIVCSFTGKEQELHGFLKKIINKKIPVYSFETKRRTLQTAYMDIAKTQEDNGEANK